MSGFDRQVIFRRLLKARLFARVYGRVIGPASAQMFAEPLRRELLEHLPPHARVLEVGCGPGLQAIETARQRADLELVASDFSPPFVRLATAKAQPGARITFEIADAMDLSGFPPESFDGVYSMTAIKHFPDPVRGLRECLRLVRPGGRLVVTEIRREAGLDEVRALVELFRAPGWLKRPMTRLVHSGLTGECPPLAEVRRWVSVLDAPDTTAVVRELPGWPAWVATFRREPAARGRTALGALQGE